MNCHENSKEPQESQNHSLLKHIIHMIICCGLPIVILGFLPVINAYSPAAGSVISKFAPFLCPVMMILMVVMMLGGNKKKDCCNNENTDNKSLELNKNTK